MIKCVCSYDKRVKCIGKSKCVLESKLSCCGKACHAATSGKDIK